MIGRFLLELLFISNVFHKLINSQKCVVPDLTLSRNIENEGFHRKLQFLIEWNNNDDSLNNCDLQIHLRMTKEIFVSPDEIDSLNHKSNQYQIFIDTKYMNIEATSHHAKPFNLSVFLPKFWPTRNYTLEIPIHLRYQRAQIAGKYAKALLPKPSLLIHCPDNNNIRKLENYPQSCFIKTVCAPLQIVTTTPTNTNCTWLNVTYTSGGVDTSTSSLSFEDYYYVEMLVPIGNLDDYPIVSIVTLLLGCAGCIYTLSILSTTRL